jgi:hypothetical protein
MADPIKELKEGLVEGIRRLIESDYALKQITVPQTGKTPGSGAATGGGNGFVDDMRATTGYANGQTTVAFTLGLSELDGTDGFSM